MSRDAPGAYWPTLLEDMNADISDALEHLEAGRLTELGTALAGLRDAVRENIDEIEETAGQTTPPPAPPASEPNVQRVLDVSTAHLTDEERTRLEAGELPGQSFRGEYGGLVYPNVEGEPPDGMSETLWAIWRHAVDRGCGYILFDRDGPTLPDFPVLEEA
jgi:hypothetical protein